MRCAPGQNRAEITYIVDLRPRLLNIRGATKAPMAAPVPNKPIIGIEMAERLRRESLS